LTLKLYWYIILTSLNYLVYNFYIKINRGRLNEETLRESE